MFAAAIGFVLSTSPTQVPQSYSELRNLPSVYRCY
jgi:hypothetical protein